MEQEIWKTAQCWRPVKGRLDTFNNDYEVNEFGVVRNKHTKHVCKQRTDRDGYMRVSLYACKNKPLDTPVHLIVATTFLGTAPDGCTQINHKDENKQNNHISNLEWCDAKYNNSYGTGTARRSLARLNGPRSFETLQIDPISNEVIKVWPSTMEAERVLGIPNAQISCACKHGTKCRGFYWKHT